MTDTSPFPLTYLRLRFHCQAETPLRLGGLRAGSNLRGALLGVMRRAVCDETGNTPPAPDHAARCPVCWLAAANEHPGQERRGYAITPPLPLPNHLASGEPFAFHITLFGDALRYLPYFVLSVPEAGHEGVGTGRGRFRLDSIYAEFPLGMDWPVLQEGHTLVCPPEHAAAQDDILRAADAMQQNWQAQSAPDKPITLRCDFLTPLRLIVDERLLKTPDFGALFAHVLRRIDGLAAQHAGCAPRPPEDCQRLWDTANRVRLFESQASWQDVSSGSSRTGQQTWISGLTGPAWYVAPLAVWQDLLPWLLWGEVAQVGKDTAKGNGVYRLRLESPT